MGWVWTFFTRLSFFDKILDKILTKSDPLQNLKFLKLTGKVGIAFDEFRVDI